VSIKICLSAFLGHKHAKEKCGIFLFVKIKLIVIFGV